MSSHPYQDLPDHAFWRRAVAAVPPDAVDPLARVPFRLSRSDKVVTAGSCFAQHIARYLGRVGCTHHVTEQAHPLVADIAGEEWNYGVFSARYGNIYTTRQLVQLFDRAHGRFAPEESVWRDAQGGFLDPFRPQIQPGGFSSHSLHHCIQADALAHRHANLPGDLRIKITDANSQHWAPG